MTACSGCDRKGKWGVGLKNPHNTCNSTGRMKCPLCQGRGVE
jgi:hypothetical protein